MSTYRLDKLFSPRSVAVVGASPRDTSPGRAVLRNLRAAGFEGSVSLVNPRYGEIEGIKAVKTIQELRQAPDLLVIATPPQSVPGIVAAAGEKRAATAVIIAAGLIEWSAAHDIGFSAAVSLGDRVDVDFGDLLDFFALDGATRAILLYI